MASYSISIPFLSTQHANRVSVPLSRTRFPARQVIRRNVGKQEITLRHPSHPLPSIPGNQGQCHRVHNHQPTPLGVVIVGVFCRVYASDPPPAPDVRSDHAHLRENALQELERLHRLRLISSFFFIFFFYFPVICSNKHKHVGVGGGESFSINYNNNSNNKKA